LCPKHVGETAADAVPATARAAIAKTTARTTRVVVGFTTFVVGRSGAHLNRARKTNAAANTAEHLFAWSTKKACLESDLGVRRLAARSPLIPGSTREAAAAPDRHLGAAYG
jgi:hypothetical protein